MYGYLALAIGASILLLWVIVTYNRLIRLRNQQREGWSGVEVQLKRRHDLVPPLVECVKGYQAHEKELLESVTRERGEAAVAAVQGAAAAGTAETTLGRDLGRVVALAENYPQLKADETFRDLMTRLVEVEDQIQYARRYYNGAVRDLRNQVESFPSNLVAKFYGFEGGAYFEVESASERLAPELKLGGS